MHVPGEIGGVEVIEEHDIRCNGANIASLVKVCYSVDNKGKEEGTKGEKVYQ